MKLLPRITRVHTRTLFRPLSGLGNMQYMLLLTYTEHPVSTNQRLEILSCYSSATNHKRIQGLRMGTITLGKEPQIRYGGLTPRTSRVHLT